MLLSCEQDALGHESRSVSDRLAVLLAQSCSASVSKLDTRRYHKVCKLLPVGHCCENRGGQEQFSKQSS